MKYIPAFIIVSLLCSASIIAQKNSYDNSNDQSWRNAMELFEKQMYVAASPLFKTIAETDIPGCSLRRQQARYYETLCALNLYNNDAELMANRFQSEFPESPLVNDIRFRLGNFYYFKKSYRDAIRTYSILDKKQLSEEDNAEYYFKSGYCWYMLDSLDKARMAFYEIKDVDTKYTSPALYYYSHIAYSRKQYETALDGFKRLKDDETFAQIVPYYISQCYYLQGKYSDFVAYAPPLLDSIVESRVAETSRMIADAYYRQNKYKEAIPYFEKYFKEAPEKKNEDYFQAGLCYYQTGAYDKAIPMFERVSVNETAMGQYAAYHLAGCLLKKGDKAGAMKAFYSASHSDFDSIVREDAMFQYALLTYELSNSPFNDAQKALNDYLAAYPNSPRAEQAYQYLVAVYMNTRNYKDALSYIEKISIKDKKLRFAYQRAAFFRGLELFNNLDFQTSITYFDKSLNYAENDPQIAARAYYWGAEAYYRLKDYSSAINYYNLFLASPSFTQCEENSMVTYNMGYCYFSKKEYSTAQNWFDKYLNQHGKEKTTFAADGYNRRGDCSFIQMKYWEAITFYNQSITLGLSGLDYAMFQKAFCYGLLGKHAEKVALLNKLITTDSTSSYVDAALFEMGRSNAILQQNDKALQCYNSILVKYKSGSYSGKALVNIGLLKYNEGKNTQALETYKQVVAEYPGTPEARSALTGIKNIYVDLNEVDSYIEYVGKVGGWALMGQNSQDSISFQAAENLYMSGDCKKSMDGLDKYISKYPEGIFSVEAHFYRADCLLKNKKTDEALGSLQYVVKQPRSVFTEQALLKLAVIYADKKSWNEALATYQRIDSVASLPQNKLLAEYNIMLIQYQNNSLDKASGKAEQLLSETTLPQEYERLARLIRGKNLYAQKNYSPAMVEFKKVATDLRNAEGAEAEYLFCEALYKSGKTDKAQAEIFSFIDRNSPHQYWLAKSFILLADIYQGKKDDYQAVSTLQSVIDNYSAHDDGIIQIAKEKLVKVKGSYVASDSIKHTEDLQIKLKK